MPQPTGAAKHLGHSLIVCRPNRESCGPELSSKCMKTLARLIQVLRPKEKICVFPVTSPKKLG